MAIKVPLSFKETSVEEVELFAFLEEDRGLIGRSTYIKSLIKEKKKRKERDEKLDQKK